MSLGHTTSERGWSLRQRGIAPTAPRRGSRETLRTRDLEILVWLGEQYAARVDQLETLLDCGPRTVQRVIARLREHGLITTRRLLVGEAAWVIPTSTGLRATGAGFKTWEPRLGLLAHVAAVNDVRLHVQGRSPGSEWVPERLLARERQPAEHLPDGVVLFDGQRVAIEVGADRQVPATDHSNPRRAQQPLRHRPLLLRARTAPSAYPAPRDGPLASTRRPRTTPTMSMTATRGRGVLGRRGGSLLRRSPQAPSAPASPASLIGEADGERGFAFATRLAGERALPIDAGQVLLSPERMCRHLLVCGATGSGKTETLLRIAWTVAKESDAPVFYLDGKGDRETAARFYGLMADAGRTSRVFPNEPFDGWRGQPHEIQGRLMEIIDYCSEGPASWYRDVAKNVLRLVCEHPDGPPRSSQTVLERMNLDTLTKAHKGSSALAALNAQLVRQVRLRYEAFFGPDSRSTRR